MRVDGIGVGNVKRLPVQREAEGQAHEHLGQREAREIGAGRERDGTDHVTETADEGSGHRTVHDRGDDERHEAEADADVPCAEGTESCQNDLESDKN